MTTQTTTTVAPEFSTFQAALDWIREINRPARFVVMATGPKRGKRELWRGFPSGKCEYKGIEIKS